jgi:hypothetical protein
MESKERWSTTVDDLMLNFREALASLVPYMERVKIGWRDEEAYDDWDNISQVLYENMVLRSVQFSTERQEALVTPDYGTIYLSYGDKSFIEVVDDGFQLSGYKVFVGFSTLEHPFDQVSYQVVSGPDLRAVGDPGCMPLVEVSFKFVVNKGTGEREKLSTLEVEA